MAVIFSFFFWVGGWIWLFGSIDPLALAGWIFVHGLLLMCNGALGVYDE